MIPPYHTTYACNMAPSDYISARKQLLATTGDGESSSSSSSTEPPRYSIDGQVYQPSVSAIDGDDDSIRIVVGAIFQLSADVVSSLQVKSVTGGITNKLYHVSGIAAAAPAAAASTKDATSPLPDEVLFRIFGGHGMIDRDVETSTYAALANQGIALKYYGRFSNGRLEEWYPNAKHLAVRELSSRPDLSRGIARSLGRLHSKFVIPRELQEYHNPEAPPTLWTQLESWLDQALHATFTKDSDTRRADALSLSRLKNELAWLKKDVCKSNAKIGFCHNDLLAANILRSCQQYDSNEQPQHEGIQLIDFEYGGMNYLAYDIANHFNEFAGGTNAEDNATPDYSLFPSPDVQKAFCEEYVKACGGGGGDVPALLEEIKGFVLANHLVWGLWAVNQAATEGCEEFDYLHYGSCRIQRYFLEKKQWESEHKHDS
mmetsp:Transcript_86744/g.242788  ORF Transcript_86744/g.242788 Transcript_86744/m.242788 type:complete len:430 (-) Transcript_86744:76-1365(-)